MALVLLLSMQLGSSSFSSSAIELFLSCDVPLIVSVVKLSSFRLFGLGFGVGLEGSLIITGTNLV